MHLVAKSWLGARIKIECQNCHNATDFKAGEASLFLVSGFAEECQENSQRNNKIRKFQIQPRIIFIYLNEIAFSRLTTELYLVIPYIKNHCKLKFDGSEIWNARNIHEEKCLTREELCTSI